MTALTTDQSLHLATLPEAIRADLYRWRRMIDEVAGVGGRLTHAVEHVAERHGVAAKTLLRKLYAWRNSKGDWRSIVDKRLARELQASTCPALPRAFVDHWKTVQQRYQRDTTGKAAHRALIRAWKAGEAMPGYATAPVADPATGLPAGWTYRNLIRHRLSKFERAASRVGRMKAATFLPKVHTTRIGIAPGQVFLVDDQDYDVQVAFLGINRKLSRPSGFNCLDLSSACDIFRGYKPTILNGDGTKQKLRQVDFEWFLVGLLTTIGYREDTGTTIIGELGTAKAGADFMARVADATNGQVRWDSSGVHGEQLCGLFKGQPRGNPRYKAARESWFNLLRNEMAALPGPTGLDRHHAPEENYGLDQYTRKLLDAASAVPVLAEKLRLPVLRWQDFVFAADKLAELINNRHDHDLEGWENLGRVEGEWRLSDELPWLPTAQLLALPEPQRAVAHAMVRDNPVLWKHRKLSPAEVWEPAKPELKRVTGALVPVLLGPDAARTASVTDDHHLVIADSEVDPEPMIFDAALTNGRILAQRQPVQAFLNPYIPTELQITDEAGRFLGTAPRVQRICKTDTEALQRRYGKVRKIESALLAPVAARGSAMARERIDLHRHNARVLEQPEPQHSDATRARLRDERGQLEDLLPAGVTAEAAPENFDDLDQLL